MDIIIFEAFMGKKSVSLTGDLIAMPEDTVGFTYIHQNQIDENGIHPQIEYRIGTPFEDFMQLFDTNSNLANRMLFESFQGANFGVYKESGNNHFFTIKKNMHLVSDKQELIEAFNRELGLEKGKRM